MYDVIKNLYYVTLLAMFLQFAGLREPFAVLMGLTFLYFGVAELFMKEELDRLRRMNSVGYMRRADVSIAFTAMTLGFGIYYLASGFHYRLRYPLSDLILAAGTLGALYVFLHPYLPRPRGGRPRHLRPIR